MSISGVPGRAAGEGWQTARMRSTARTRPTAAHIWPAAVAALAVVALTACSGDDHESHGDPQAQLDRAAELLNEATSVRVDVEGEGLPDDGTVVLRAEGVAVPPSSFEGDIRVQAGPLPATVSVISIDGQLWAELPLTSGFEEIDAAELGIGDPGLLMDPDQGVSQLLTAGTDVTAADDVRIDGEVYHQVESVLPGELVDAILAISDPAAEVQATWALDPDSGQLRQAVLTGPFYAGGDQTYTVSLDGYNEPAEISAPDS